MTLELLFKSTVGGAQSTSRNDLPSGLTDIVAMPSNNIGLGGTLAATLGVENFYFNDTCELEFGLKRYRFDGITSTPVLFQQPIQCNETMIAQSFQEINLYPRTWSARAFVNKNIQTRSNAYEIVPTYVDRFFNPHVRLNDIRNFLALFACAPKVLVAGQPVGGTQAIRITDNSGSSFQFINTNGTSNSAFFFEYSIKHGMMADQPQRSSTLSDTSVTVLSLDPNQGGTFHIHGLALQFPVDGATVRPGVRYINGSRIELNQAIGISLSQNLSSTLSFGEVGKIYFTETGVVGATWRTISGATTQAIGISGQNTITLLSGTGASFPVGSIVYDPVGGYKGIVQVQSFDVLTVSPTLPIGISGLLLHRTVMNTPDVPKKMHWFFDGFSRWQTYDPWVKIEDDLYFCHSHMQYGSNKTGVQTADERTGFQMTPLNTGASATVQLVMSFQGRFSSVWLKIDPNQSIGTVNYVIDGFTFTVTPQIGEEYIKLDTKQGIGWNSVNVFASHVSTSSPWQGVLFRHFDVGSTITPEEQNRHVYRLEKNQRVDQINAAGWTTTPVGLERRYHASDLYAKFNVQLSPDTTGASTNAYVGATSTQWASMQRSYIVPGSTAVLSAGVWGTDFRILGTGSSWYVMVNGASIAAGSSLGAWRSVSTGATFFDVKFGPLGNQTMQIYALDVASTISETKTRQQKQFFEKHPTKMVLSAGPADPSSFRLADGSTYLFDLSSDKDFGGNLIIRPGSTATSFPVTAYPQGGGSFVQVPRAVIISPFLSIYSQSISAAAGTIRYYPLLTHSPPKSSNTRSLTFTSVGSVNGTGFKQTSVVPAGELLQVAVEAYSNTMTIGNQQIIDIDGVENV